MKLAKIEHAGQVAGAVIAGTEVRVITPWHAGPANTAPFDLAMLPLPVLRLRSEKATEILALDAVKLAPPLGLLSKIICLGYSYRQHAQEVSAEIGDTPSVFTKERSALVGQGEPVVRPEE